MLRLCRGHNTKVMNTYFKKRREHLISYKVVTLKHRLTILCTERKRR